MKNIKNLVDTKTPRDFAKEAQELVKDLRRSDCYALYEMVSNMLKKANSKERDQELYAVKHALEHKPELDYGRLKNIWNGFKTDMAKHARPKDGQTKVNKRKV